MRIVGNSIFSSIITLVKKKRSDVCGLHIPSFKLSAFADDVIVLISGTSDVNILLKILDFGHFIFFFSAKLNWKKSEAFLLGKWLKVEPRLPDGLKWNRVNIKIFTLYLYI